LLTALRIHSTRLGFWRSSCCIESLVLLYTVRDLELFHRL
jgi:hypothetical protein